MDFWAEPEWADTQLFLFDIHRLPSIERNITGLCSPKVITMCLFWQVDYEQCHLCKLNIENDIRLQIAAPAWQLRSTKKWIKQILSCIIGLGRFLPYFTHSICCSSIGRNKSERWLAVYILMWNASLPLTVYYL